MQYNFSGFELNINKIAEYLNKEYNQLNVGRASPIVLGGVSVESYGSRVSLKNIASISIEDPKTLRIIPWDKNQIKEIEKSIISSNLGLSIIVDESGIRVIFPQLTTETRQILVKVLKEKLETGRITVRKEREKIWSDIQSQEKNGEMTEDEKFKAKENLQKTIDEIIVKNKDIIQKMMNCKTKGDFKKVGEKLKIKELDESEQEYLKRVGNHRYIELFGAF